MPNDAAVDPQGVVEVGLPEEWREHVRELRSENARRRKENQELRGQLAALEGAQAAAAERAQRDAARLATVQGRLKGLELARLTREALAEAATGGAETPRLQGRQLDMGRAQRLLELVPAPVALDADLVVDDEGRVVVSPEAAERLRGYVAEVAELASVEAAPTGKMPVPPAAPPVGGEPPKADGPGAGRLVNSWDPQAQPSVASRVRAGAR
ncbi:MAG: hypothetical protein FJ291_33345 [Planctomycetes bacterium]|nr:hypothetical protein [Planctomycetota bacterium]